MASTSRQVTLMESWGGGRGRRGVPSGGGVPNGRGRGGRSRGRGGSAVTGRGRRGRGRGGSASVTVPAAHQSSSADVGGFEDDEDDDDVLCVQALSNFELVTNEISQGFAEVNEAKELPGFDKIAGDIWIYPTNRPVRDYQFSIIQTALYHNTMVSLPTGLGKTFIAAVLMYNFHRWYPNNLIIFMAPTRPLVTQQLDACHELMGIHPSKMVELTGQIPPKRREDLWKDKKVFFLTPQVLTSDLARGSCLPEQVRCIVVDEAHKSLGNHAYVEVIKMVIEKNKCFRILALSATPGNDALAVQEVLKNLLISRIELRNETSPDILPYTHEKQVETIVVPLDNHIESVHRQLMEIFQTYTGKLMRQNALFGRDGSSFTQFQLLKAREAYRQNQKPGVPNFQKGFIEVEFATCISLAHAMDLLLIHGLRSFYSFLHCVMCKEKGTPAVAAELKKSTNIQEILQEVQEKLNISAENSFFDLSTSGLFTTFSKPSTSTALPEPINPEDYLLSHPKMRVLRDLVEKHFKSQPTGTRIMVFSEYRDSVQEIGNMLNALRPLVKPMVFLGQSKGAGVGGRGLRQKEQVQVVQSFRSGEFNVLVSTCVGEEGLDIGEVDLIICYDMSKSPTRLVQRMGRTGRKREGKTIFLLAQGREHRMYTSSVHQHRNISKGITDASLLHQVLYKESPRMVPAGLVPQCFKMDIVLSSDQKKKTDEPEIIELDGDVPNPRNKKSKRTTSRKSTGASSSPSSNGTVVTPRADSNGGGKNTNTIARCFENMQQNGTGKSKEREHAAKLATIAEEVALDDDEVQILEMEDHNTSFTLYDNEVDKVGSDYKKHLRELLGIKDVEAGTVTKCVYVPKLSRASVDPPNLSPSDFEEIAKDFDIERLREHLNSVYVLGPPSSRCDCGLLLVDDDMMDLDLEMDQVEDDDINFSNQNLLPEEDPWSSPGRRSASPPLPYLASNQVSPEMAASPPRWAGDQQRFQHGQIEPAAKPGDHEEGHMSDSSFEAAFIATDFNDVPGLDSDKERDEPSPIFKRLRRSLTPGKGKRLFDKKEPTPPLPVVQNKTPERRSKSRSIPSIPSSPDEYPPSPVFIRQPRRVLVKQFSPTKVSTTKVTGRNQQLEIQTLPTPRPQIPLTSPPSSDATNYESETSIDERDLGLSPIITRTIPKPPTPAQPPKKVLFGGAKAVEGEKVPGKDGPVPKTPSRSQQSEAESPDFYPASQIFGRKPPGTRKLFTFRKKENQATAVIPFQELLNESPSPTPARRMEPVPESTPNSHTTTVPTVNSTVHSNQSQPFSQNRATASSGPLFETTSQDLGLFPLDSDDDDAFFVPSNSVRVPASGTVKSSGESVQSRRGGTTKETRITRRKRRRNGNGFILEEAEVEGDESSSTEGSDSDLDGFDDSFVAVEESPPIVTESQQIRYIQSVKETPDRKFGRRKSLDQIALERVENPNEDLEHLNLDEDDEDNTQFCVPNDYEEYVTAGDFTQRMDEAWQAIQLESPSSHGKRATRSTTRRGRAAMVEPHKEFKLPTTKPRRKRIIVVSSDDSE